MQISCTKRQAIWAAATAGILVLAATGFWLFKTNRLGAKSDVRNCPLTPFSSPFIGFSLEYRLCDGKNRQTLRPVGNTLYLVEESKAGNPVHWGKPMIDTFTKSAEETIETAMRRQFGLQDGCSILAAKENGINDSGKQFYKLVDDSRTGQCGAHESDGITQYIEYHPDETNTRYLLVRRSGELAEAFDPQSIVMLDDEAVQAGRARKTQFRPTNP